MSMRNRLSSIQRKTNYLKVYWNITKNFNLKKLGEYSHLNFFFQEVPPPSILSCVDQLFQECFLQLGAPDRNAAAHLCAFTFAYFFYSLNFGKFWRKEREGEKERCVFVCERGREREREGEREREFGKRWVWQCSCCCLSVYSIPPFRILTFLFA